MDGECVLAGEVLASVLVLGSKRYTAGLRRVKPAMLLLRPAGAVDGAGIVYTYVRRGLIPSGSINVRLTGIVLL